MSLLGFRSPMSNLSSTSLIVSSIPGPLLRSSSASDSSLSRQIVGGSYRATGEINGNARFSAVIQSGLDLGDCSVTLVGSVFVGVSPELRRVLNRASELKNSMKKLPFNPSDRSFFLWCLHIVH